ncbi:MAG: Asp-tRNA(Asn)/Glu-tRNA(Gln) amidotransferase GatCAB subunit A [Acidobacteria bacterium]|nr:MAG: Asp-tRNA(Asn)/Glu-tRNA(Gln) amidotransferase GatCAB subunit A [Acidobacteriota bacterium]
MSGLTTFSATEIARRVAARDVSAEEVARAHLARIAEADGGIDAFLHVAAERAVAKAREVDAAIAAGGTAPPLAGVPVAVKDVLDIQDLPTTCGSRILDGYRPPFTATAVARLEAAGAVVLGKTNMDEFAMGSSTENSAFKPTRNPWARDRVPGGSSGGSAAAVAAGMAAAALGTDTGGSIRQPAAMCGVVGLKPTYGRVSRYGLVAFASSLDQIGPIARSVEDVARMAEALCGWDPRDATSARMDVPAFVSGLRADARGLRIGVPWKFLAAGVDEAIMTAFRAAIDAFRAAGAVVVEVDLPHVSHAIATYYIVATAEASSNLARYDGVRYGLRAGQGADLRRMYGETRDRGFGPEVKRRIILGTFVLSSGYYDAYYLRAQKVRTLIRRDFEQALTESDVIATPTTPSPAFRLGEKTADPLQMYLADIFTVPANLAGIPGLSLPCGLAEELPAGLQLLGRPFDEATLLRAGHAYQSVTNHHLARPPQGGSR